MANFSAYNSDEHPNSSTNRQILTYGVSDQFFTLRALTSVFDVTNISIIDYSGSYPSIFSYEFSGDCTVYVEPKNKEGEGYFVIEVDYYLEEGGELQGENIYVYFNTSVPSTDTGPYIYATKNGTTKWWPATAYVYNNSAWKQVTVYIKGGNW